MRKETIQKLNDFQVIDLYNSGKTIAEIMIISKLGENTISKYLHDNNVSIRKAAKRESGREKPIIGEKFGQWTIISTEIKSGTLLGKNDRNLY